MKRSRFSPFAVHRLTTFILTLALFSLSIPQVGFAFEADLSADDKVEVFDKVWKLVNNRYYDPKMNGVDWISLRDQYKPKITQTKNDLEFYDIVKRMVGEMKDAHTRFLTPREARERRGRKGTTVGVLLSSVEAKTVIEKVLPNPTGDLAKVKPGMIVRSVDGVPIDNRIADVKKELGGSSSEIALEILVYRKMLRGEPGTSATIGLIDENGKDFYVTLVRQVVSQTSEAIGRVLPSGLGYISVSSFKSPIYGKFKKALLELKDTPALIIDLRYNGGGSISEVLNMAGVFLDKRYEFGKFMKRDGTFKQSQRKFSAGKRGKQLYAKPLIVLTSKFSASGSELFASSLQELGRAKVVGTQTCGCLLGISRKYKLKDGSELHISDIGFISAKGKIYEKVGVTPDRVIEPKIADLLSGFDRGLTVAENMISVASANQ